MKTAVTVLQEMMIKLGQTPEYECISQSGPQHQSTFEYRCMSCGVVVTAVARSKKEAKQEVARLMLHQLAQRGHSVPPPYGLAAPHPGPQYGLSPGGVGVGAGVGAGGCDGAGAGAGTDSRSYVALLKELCEEYKLPGVEYELVGDTGPAHMRQFTVRARMGQRARDASASTKKMARQRAADQLYHYLRENLARVTSDFVEEDALVRARDKAMEKYQEARDQPAWRPDLGQRVADYHLGLARQIEGSRRLLALEALAAQRGPDALAAAAAAAAWAAAGLQVEWTVLEQDTSVEAAMGREGGGGGEVCVLTVGEVSPALAFAGSSHEEAARASLRYLRAALRPPREGAAPDLLA